ncbi:hypothetical protein Lal_00021889 [Lupinus albus]|uniref:Putative DnaJ domain-containing protein n=1 Tax=Lupinus albus TaxID=3870 RepID=A0A6A4MXH7_LUPAL|nr:putative DnaJ domain-containing protein [Lupinus albus]KAF1864466.1 hypothetical protein Lal_00021889 [Lupinus albus]
MDESWRMRMGLPACLPRRRSMEDRASSSIRQYIFSGTGNSVPENMDPDDFADVFGGPPRSLLMHKLSRSKSFYDEIFQPPDFTSPALLKGGRRLPVFRFPAKNDTFYSDIFDDRRSRERSGLSSEDVSPLRPVIRDDVALSAFASKLRPINVPCRWDSSTMMPEEHSIKQGKSLFPCNTQSFEVQYADNEYKENIENSHLGFSRRISSPETVSLESKPCQSIKMLTDDWELSSPFSAVSGLCQEPDAKSSVHVLPELVIDEDDNDDDDDEIMSSFVIEVNSNLRDESCETTAVDEAIAWAKEKFQSRNSDDESRLRKDIGDRSAGMEGRPETDEYHDDEIRKVKSPKKLEPETEKLDRDIRLWSSGKETDIRLLLSSLHHILWPESGWYAIPIMSLIQSSQVKKAYQKARLCLHPDKLQQRGATVLQKYIAQKVFSILQDAWTSFISEDVSF